MDKAQAFIAGLGGAENIQSVEPCITRLRVVVNNPEAVNEAELTEHGAIGVVMDNQVVHVVVGPIADELAASMTAEEA